MITCIGDLVEDVTVLAPEGLRPGTDSPARIERHRGGSAANVAVAACSIGAAARFVGNVGADLLGDHLLDQLAKAGVEAKVTRTGRSGSIVALIDVDGERSFLTDRGSADELTSAPAGWLIDCSVVHVPMYSLLNDPLRSTTLVMLREAQRQRIAVSLDASSTGAIKDAGVEQARELLEAIGPDVLFCNREEAELLEVSDGRRFAARTIIKNGAEPTVLISASGVVSYPVPAVAHVLDTTGAGDSFAAAFLATFFSSDGSEEESIAAGHKLAARTLTTLGATPLPLAQ